MARRLTALLCATLVLASCGLIPTRTLEWDNGEMSFRYPATWTVWGPDEPMELLRPHVFAYLGNLPVDVEALCERDANGTSCDFGGYELAPGGVVVGVLGWSLPGQRLPDEGERRDVGGREARLVRGATDRGTERLCWTIDHPYGYLLAICAEIQGPEEDRLRDQVESLIDSIQFTAPS